MLSLKQELSALFSDAFEAAGYERRFGEVVESQRPELCQWQCNGAMAAAKPAKKNPREAAQAVLDKLAHREWFSDLSLAGPGFINITLTDAALAPRLGALALAQDLGCRQEGLLPRTVIDFGGPNVAKPMQVHHLRSSVIGDSLQRLLRAVGSQVTSFNHLGDWGTQMGMLIHGLKGLHPEWPYFDPAFQGSYPAASPISIQELEELYPRVSARCKADEKELEQARLATQELQSGRPGYRALWKHFVDISTAELKRDFGSMGVMFDEWKGESAYHDKIPGMIAALKSAGVAQESEGALVIFVEVKGKGEVPPLLLRKSDGSYLYATTDLAAIQERVQERQAGQVLYVTDKRQEMHFAQVFAAAQKSGMAGQSRLVQVAFGTMNGKDGKPFKTREGGGMKLKDLIDMVTEEAAKKMKEAGVAEEYPESERQVIAAKVGLAALKFADLSNHRLTDYIFDLEKFTRFEGKTGPYMLYADVRIKSILRKAQEAGFPLSSNPQPGEVERPLALQLLRFPDAVALAAEQLSPNLLCEFLYELSQEFSRFYEKCHILSEVDEGRRGLWLGLSSLCLAELEMGLGLLGIETPERM